DTGLLLQFRGISLEPLLAEWLAPVRRRGGTGEAQPDAPLVPRRDEDERIEPARQRLGVAAELLVNPATALLIEEDTSAVLAVTEPMAPLPPPPLPDKQRPTLKRGIILPSLLLEAAPLVLGDGHLVVPATVAATVTVPVLPDRQATDRKRHA